MLHTTLPLAFLALSLPLAASLDAARSSSSARDSGNPGLDGIRLAQVAIHEPVIIRVPRMAGQSRFSASLRVSQPPPEQRWKEKRGPRCIAVQAMAGALVRGPNMIDVIMAGGKRMRAHLDDECKPLDFYSGFYLRPSADGQVCAKRDSIQARSGATCRIARFRRLEEKH